MTYKIIYETTIGFFYKTWDEVKNVNQNKIINPR